MNLRLTTLLAATAAFTMASAQDTAKPAAAPAEAAKPAAAPADASADPMAGVELNKVSYFIGRNIGKNMSGQGFKPDLDRRAVGREHVAQCLFHHLAQALEER